MSKVQNGELVSEQITLHRDSTKLEDAYLDNPEKIVENDEIILSNGDKLKFVTEPSVEVYKLWKRNMVVGGKDERTGKTELRFTSLDTDYFDRLCKNIYDSEGKLIKPSQEYLNGLNLKAFRVIEIKCINLLTPLKALVS